MELKTGQHSNTILIVDDEIYIAALMARWLELERYQCAVAHNFDEAIAWLEKRDFDLLVSDIKLPGKSGVDLLKVAREQYPDLAVIMATAVSERKVAIETLRLGAFGYLIKPFDKNEFLINVANALERRRLSLKSREYERHLQQEVFDRTGDIRDREQEIAMRLVWASEYRDDETGDHIRRIGRFSAMLAKSLHSSPGFAEDIGLAAPMHDVGKIGVSDAILLKPGPLTHDEFERIKKHAEIGAEILGGSNIPLLQLASSIALSHHEKWDGTGYPQGLAGRDIPEAARIVAIVDVYDALSYDRIYRKAFPEDKVMDIMHENRGRHFDPELFDCFLEVLPAFRKAQATSGQKNKS